MRSASPRGLAASRMFHGSRGGPPDDQASEEPAEAGACSALFASVRRERLESSER